MKKKELEELIQQYEKRKGIVRRTFGDTAEMDVLKQIYESSVVKDLHPNSDLPNKVVRKLNAIVQSSKRDKGATADIIEKISKSIKSQMLNIEKQDAAINEISAAVDDYNKLVKISLNELTFRIESFKSGEFLPKNESEIRTEIEKLQTIENELKDKINTLHFDVGASYQSAKKSSKHQLKEIHSKKKRSNIDAKIDLSRKMYDEYYTLTSKYIQSLENMLPKQKNDNLMTELNAAKKKLETTQKLLLNVAGALEDEKKLAGNLKSNMALTLNNEFSSILSLLALHTSNEPNEFAKNIAESINSILHQDQILLPFPSIDASTLHTKESILQVTANYQTYFANIIRERELVENAIASSKNLEPPPEAFIIINEKLKNILNLYFIIENSCTSVMLNQIGRYYENFYDNFLKSVRNDLSVHQFHSQNTDVVELIGLSSLQKNILKKESCSVEDVKSCFEKINKRIALVSEALEKGEFKDERDILFIKNQLTKLTEFRDFFQAISKTILEEKNRTEKLTISTHKPLTLLRDTQSQKNNLGTKPTENKDPSKNARHDSH